MTNQEKRNLLNTELLELKEKVSSNDYKNTKNGEAQRAGVAYPYDPIALYKLNQSYRDRMNEIEEELKTIPEEEEGGEIHSEIV